jgi:hypothetical protein
MKYIYIVYLNDIKGSRHWYMDRIYTTKKSAEKRISKIKPKFGKGAYLIDKWKLYD